MAKNDNSKICAALSYILVGIIWYFVDEKMKKDKFANFHAKQGLMLLIVDVVGYIILGAIPIIGWAIMPLFSIFIIVLVILGIVNALNDKQKELPIIGQYAKKFTF